MSSYEDKQPIELRSFHCDKLYSIDASTASYGNNTTTDIRINYHIDASAIGQIRQLNGYLTNIGKELDFNATSQTK